MLLVRRAGRQAGRASDGGTLSLVFTDHIIGFKLSSDDIFHHALFMPVIGGMHFAFPCKCVRNSASLSHYHPSY